MSVKQTEEKITALYERLSRDDDLAGDSSSIVNHDVICKGRIYPSKYIMTAARLWEMARQLWERRKKSRNRLFS